MLYRNYYFYFLRYRFKNGYIQVRPTGPSQIKIKLSLTSKSKGFQSFTFSLQCDQIHLIMLTGKKLFKAVQEIASGR